MHHRRKVPRRKSGVLSAASRKTQLPLFKYLADRKGSAAGFKSGEFVRRSRCDSSGRKGAEFQIFGYAVENNVAETGNMI
jgi:hypothetical protein